MKKLLTACAACVLAGMVSAQVESVNVVGYSTSDVKANDYTMFGVNFEAVGGGEVAIQDYFVGDFIGGPTPAEADMLMVWTASTGYVGYYFGYWGDPENPGWDNKWYNVSDDAETTDTIPAGAACWILRRGAAMDLTVSGQVKATDTVVNIKANDYTMLSNPYPSDISLNSGVVAANAVGGPTPAEADMLMLWNATAGYVGYYYGYWGDPENPSWDNKWYNVSDDAEATDSLMVGQAAWYLRRGAATTITFTSPL